MTTPAEPADADLDDLLEEGGSGKAAARNHLEMTPLNLDHLTKGQLDVTPYNKKKNNNTTGVSSLVINTCSYLAYAHPRLCGGCALLSIFLLLATFVNLVMNPTETFGTIVGDYQQYSIPV